MYEELRKKKSTFCYTKRQTLIFILILKCLVMPFSHCLRTTFDCLSLCVSQAQQVIFDRYFFLSSHFVFRSHSYSLRWIIDCSLSSVVSIRCLMAHLFRVQNYLFIIYLSCLTIFLSDRNRGRIIYTLET